MDNLSELRKLRDIIDKLDEEIAGLLVKRLDNAKKIGVIKRAQQKNIYDPLRERQIFENMHKNLPADFPHATAEAIWREIVSLSRQVQSPSKVAYLGPEGTFTQQAAIMSFGASAEFIAANTIATAFSWVKKQTVDYAVLPVENTLQGIVGETVDLLGVFGKPLVVGEIILPISMVFASQSENLKQIKRIYSKKEALFQCLAFLNQPDLEQAERIEVESTAAAAKKAALDPEAASISADIAANFAGVPIRFKQIEDNHGNKTRFFILGHNQRDASGHDKTSVSVKVPNVAGGLARLMRQFQEAEINMTKIDSRPIDNTADFETWFYIDFEGHISNPKIHELIKSNHMVWLGSYPIANRI